MFLSSQSDERLVRLARDGHQQAFAVIVQRYRRELTRFAARLCSDGRAEDAVQQTFLSAFTALQNGSEVKHLRGWLYTILRHHAARASDRPAVHSELGEAAAAGDSLEEAVGQRMFAFEALSEISRLPDRQRTALVATALEGRSRAEVAGHLGLSEGAVRQLVHRARSTVRAAVTAITPFPVLRWLVARQSQGSDWTGPELVAGAGGASAGAVAIKIGAVVVAGLGVAGAIAVRPQASHRHQSPVSASSSASGRGPGEVAAGAPGGATAVRAADLTPAAGVTAGLGTAAARVAGVVPGPALGLSATFTRHDGGGDGHRGGDGGRGSSGPSGSDGGDHGGSGVSSSGGGGTSSGDGSSGSGSDGGGSTSPTSGTSGSSDGGSGSLSSGSGSSGSGSSDGGSSTSGSSGSDGGSSGSTSGTTSSSDGGGSDGGMLSGGSDGGMLPDGSTSSHDSSGG